MIKFGLWLEKGITGLLKRVQLQRAHRQLCALRGCFALSRLPGKLTALAVCWKRPWTVLHQTQAFSGVHFISPILKHVKPNKIEGPHNIGVTATFPNLKW